LSKPIFLILILFKYQRLSKVVESVSKKEIPAHVKALVLEICCNDEEGNDLEVPYVKYNLPKRN